MKLKINLTLSLVILSLIAVLCSSDELNRDPERDVRQCEQRCQRQQPYFEEHKCRQVCQQRQQEKEEGSSDGGREQDNRHETVRVGDAERQYERCQQTCHGTGRVQWQCQRKCQDEYEAALERERSEHGHEHERERERERGREEERERERGREEERERERGREEEHHRGKGERYPREQDYRRCAKRCDDREEGFAKQRQCKLLCEEKYGRSKHQRHEEGRRARREDSPLNKGKGKEQKEMKENPYYFRSETFQSRYSTEEGSMRVLQRFSEKSDLLLGIDNFRVGIYEANPNTFMLPHHWDADSVLLVIKGKAVMTFVTQDDRDTFNLERGDVLMIPAGTTTYLVNTDDDEKLQIAELLHPVNTPGQYEQFFGVGGEEPESFLNSFSTEILQAALNVPSEQLEKLFKQHMEGAIIRARYGQVKAMAQRRMSARGFGQSKAPFNLLDQEPELFNEHGKYYEVTPNEYQQLEELDVSATYCDIKQGSMMAPNFNSRTTYIVLVEEGSGYFEMTCPHIGKKQNKEKESKEKESSSPRYRKVRSELSQGDAFVIPAGHPVSIVASENENLKLVGFGINAQNNHRNFLAGQENLINQLDNEAKELSFKMPAEEVEEIFNRQRSSHFMAGPQQQQQSPLLSVLDFAGF